MSRFEHTQVVARPLEETWAFFADPRNLERLMPRWALLRVLEHPPALAAGAVIRYKVGPLECAARIAEWNPPTGFTDVQVRGPYASWRHTHTLRAVDGGTEIHDRIDYRLRGGRVGAALDAAHRRTLRLVFAHRRRRLRALLGG